MDFHTLELSWRPNQFLVLPPDFAAKARAHQASPVFPLAPEQLLAAVKRVAMAEPRTSVLREDLASRSLELVQRSKLFGFPDYVDIQAFAQPNGGSALAVYSRAKYGIRDFGVNRARVQRWLAALGARSASF
jgi:uncharacterized protein (DUF1499 family)